MDPSAIGIMTAWDLRQRIRDRSVLVFGLVVPLALMFVFDLLFSGIGGADSLEPVTVVTAGAESDPIGQALVATLGSLGPDVEVTVQSSEPDAAREAVADGEAAIAVLVPDGFQAEVMSGGSPAVEVVDAGDGSLEAQVVTAVVDGFVSQVAAGSQAATAAVASGVPPDQVAAIAAQVTQAPPTVTTSPGETADVQLSVQGNLVAGQAALFMLFTVGFGVISYLTERETGTLARLEAMPIHPRSIILAKTAVSYVLGVVATAILVTAGSVLFGVDFGAPVPITVLILATVAAATSLVLLVAKVARTAEQAQVVQSILALTLGILGGAFFPIASGGLLATLSDLTPPGAFIRGLGITHGGGGVVDLGPELATVLGFAVVVLVLAFVLPSRELEA